MEETSDLNDEIKKYLKDVYGLRGYPFVNKIPIAQNLDKAWVGRAKEIEKIYEWINISKDNGQNSIIALIGDYGMGKSTTLMKITQDAQNKKLFPVLIDFRSPQRIKNPGHDLIFKIFKNANFTDIHVSHQQLEKLPGHNDVKNLFMAIFFDDEMKEKAIAYIKGEVKLSPSELKKIGIIRKLDDIDILKEYLEAFLWILKQAKFSTLVVAIDEFEYLFSLVALKDQPIYLAFFRDIYDMPSRNNSIAEGKSSNIVFIFGTSIEGWERLEKLSTGKAKNQSQDAAGAALLRRIQDYRILLKPFGKDETEQMIEKRLSISRISGKGSKGPLIPYDNDFVDFIYRETAGRLDYIIYYCHIVLRSGLQEKIQLINAEFAKKALTENNIPILNDKSVQTNLKMNQT
jgi:Cdc6-like AAA superfamily ATPase